MAEPLPTTPPTPPEPAATTTVIPSRSTWDKWLYLNADMFLRHIGTAGLVWGGVSLTHGAVNWKDLWASLLSGAILPTIFTILQKGLPGTQEGATVTANSGSTGAAPTAAPGPQNNQPKGS